MSSKEAVIKIVSEGASKKKMAGKVRNRQEKLGEVYTVSSENDLRVRCLPSVSQCGKRVQQVQVRLAILVRRIFLHRRNNKKSCTGQDFYIKNMERLLSQINHFNPWKFSLIKNKLCICDCSSGFKGINSIAISVTGFF